MSELIAEARVLVTPDTTKFAGLLITEVNAATAAAQSQVKPIAVPVVPAAAAGGAASQVVSQQVAGAVAAEAKIADAREKAAAVAAAAQATASTERIAQRETEVSALVAQERTLLLQQEKFEAERVTAATKASSARIAAKEREVAALLAADRAASASAVAAAETQAASSAAALERQLGGLSKGGASAAASLLGVRGATLAATGPFIAGAAGAIAFSKSIQLATSFNSELAVFAATTGATADEMERVSEAAKQLGKDITLPGVSAGDAAETMTEFAKAGLSVNQAIKATRGGLQLATAAQLSNADAVEVTANALNTFKLSGDQAVKVADTFANAANLAQGSIADVSLALKQSAPAAAATGVSFRDTVALLTLLAKNGLTASDAGTALRTSLIRLVNPSKKAQEILKDLNINLRDASGNVRPEVFQEFAAAQQNLAKSTQQTNAAIVFGTDGFRVISLLGRESANSLGLTKIGLDQVGTAAKVSGARMTGVAGASANLKNQMEALGLVIGQVSSGPLEDILNQLAEYAGAAEIAATKSIDLGKSLKDIAGSVPGGGFLFDVGKTGFKVGNIIGQINTAKNLIQGAFGDAEKTVKTGGDQLADAIVKAQQKGLGATFGFDKIPKAIKEQLAPMGDALTLDLALAQAGGNQNAELSLQRQIEARQQAFLDAVLKRPRTEKNVDLAKKAASNLQQTRDAITAIVEGQKADAKSAADKIASDAAAADQTVLQGLADARQRQENLITASGDTAGLADDISRQQGLKALITRQIALIRDSSIAQKTKNAAILQLTTALSQTTSAIKGLRDSAREQREQEQEQREQDRQDAFDAQVALAEAEGNTKLQLQLINARIIGINKQIAAGKAEGAALNKLKTERATLKTQREDLQNQRLSDREALAQSIFDLTGNKNPLVKALDAEIAETRADITAAKKAGDSTVQLQTALNGFLLQRKNLLKETEKNAKDGFSGFEFLQKTQGFASNLLGNLIPGFATGGLVGNISPTAGAAIPQEPLTAGIQRPGDRGVRPVQVDTTNALLRQILAQLGGRATNPPEIRQNWRTAFAELDTL